MYTRTAKDVLEPIAEAVSQLILLNSEAEINRTALPDLTEAGQTVRTHIDELRKVGESLSESASEDAELRNDMTEASAALAQAGDTLVQAAFALRDKDPRSASERARLLEGVRGIMNGVSRILNVYDEHEVRRILELTRATRAALGELRGPTLVLDQAVPRLKTACHLLVQLAHVTTRRIDELLSETLQLRLRGAVAVLGKDSPQLVSAVKTSFQFAQDAGAQEVRRTLCDGLEAIVAEIEDVVQQREEQPDLNRLFSELYRLHARIESGLAGWQAAVAAQDAPTAAAQLGEYERLNTQLLDHFRGALGEFDASEQASLATALDAASDAAAVLQQDQASLATAPPSASAVQRHTARAKSTLLLAENAFTRAIAGRVLRSNALLVDHAMTNSVLYRIDECVEKGDVARLTAVLDDFRAEAASFQREARLAVVQAGATDASCRLETAEQVVLHAERLGVLEPRLEHAASSLARHPKDAVAREHYQNVREAWEAGAGQLGRALLRGDGTVGRTLPAATIVARALETIHEQALELGDDPNKFLEAVAPLMALSLEQAEHVDDEATRQALLGDLAGLETLFAELRAPQDAGRDALVAKIRNVAAQVSRLASSLVQPQSVDESEEPASRMRAGSAVSHASRTDPETAATIDATDGDMLVVNNVAVVIADGSNDELCAASPTVGASPLRSVVVDRTTAGLIQQGEIVVINEDAPQPLTQEEAQANPIKAAAQELRIESARWSKQDNTLLQIVDQLVGHLSQLGDFHSELHGLADARRRSMAAGADAPVDNTDAETVRAASVKHGFITGATRLLQVAEQFVAQARPLSQHCKDGRLRAQLSNILEKLITLVQQLKILAAVKAASPSDNDSEVQIVTCARNIVQSIKIALHDAESATLRISAAQLVMLGPVGTELETRRRSRIVNASSTSLSGAAEPLPLLPKFRRQIYSQSSGAASSVGASKASSAAASRLQSSRGTSLAH